MFCRDTLLILEGHSSQVWCLEFSHSGDKLISGGNDFKIILWKLQQKIENNIIEVGNEGTSTCTNNASASSTSSVNNGVMNDNEGTTVNFVRSRVKSETKSIHKLRWSYNDKLILASYDDNMVCLLDGEVGHQHELKYKVILIYIYSRFYF